MPASDRNLSAREAAIALLMRCAIAAD